MVPRHQTCKKNSDWLKIHTRTHRTNLGVAHSVVFLDHWDFEPGFLVCHTTVQRQSATAVTAIVASLDTFEVVVHRCSVVSSPAEDGRGMNVPSLSHYHRHRCHWLGYTSVFDKGNCRGMEPLGLGKAHTLTA